MTTQNAINVPLPVSVANGGTGSTSLTSNAVLFGNGTSALTSVGPLTNGQLLIGNTAGLPSAATLTAGTGINLTSGAGSITIAATGAANWVDESSTSVTMSPNTSYVADNASLVTLTLPSTAALGSEFRVVYKGAGGWKVAQQSGQEIIFGTSSSTSGTSGYVASNTAGDAVHFVCTTANTTFTVLDSQGNLTVN